jgi:ABC-type antimicrobial peptide transport system permease subunit
LYFQLQQFGGNATSGATFLRALGFGATVVLLIGLLSCLAPARRALRIDPSEALRSD